MVSFNFSVSPSFLLYLLLLFLFFFFFGVFLNLLLYLLLTFIWMSLQHPPPAPGLLPPLSTVPLSTRTSTSSSISHYCSAYKQGKYDFGFRKQATNSKN